MENPLIDRRVDMLSKIKKRLRQNKRFYYLANLFRYFGNKEFSEYVRGFGGEDTVLIQHPGELYPEYIVYPISNRGEAVGFFAELQCTLKYLYYADRFCFTPVVSWVKKSLYQEDVLWDGTRNVFEYYFQPVSNMKSEEISNCKNVVFSFSRQVRAITDGDSGNGYLELDSLKLKFAQMYKKYCKLNTKTKLYIDENIREKLVGDRILGVHVRGTDFKQNFNGHPVPVNATDFLPLARNMMEEYRCDRIFLATDTIFAVKLFQQEFGDKLIFYNDIQRSDGDVGLHCLESDREHHHYKLGLEVLRDVYTLASCEYFLAGMSNVSLAAQYIRIANGSEHKKVVILDNGINRNNNDDIKWAKKNL